MTYQTRNNSDVSHLHATAQTEQGVARSPWSERKTTVDPQVSATRVRAEAGAHVL